MSELGAAAQKAIEKVQKLLTLANDRGATEAEAQRATEAAMAILEAHNLDMAAVDAKKAVRSDEYLGGGLYHWQRELWHAVAQLNFCMYWYVKGQKKGSKYEHRLVGRKENVIGTRVMAEYLQQTIERLARERVNWDGAKFFTKDSIAFREGVSDRLWHRLWRLREQRLAEERRKAEEARQNQTSRGNGTDLVLASVIKSEEEANYDFLHGEGAWAKWQERLRRAREEMDRAEREYDAWAQANPEAAKKLEAERQRQREQDAKASSRRKRAKTDREVRKNSDSYYSGWDAGENISLDQQVDEQHVRKVK